MSSTAEALFGNKPSIEQKESREGFSVSYQINYTELNFGRELGRGGFGVVHQGTWRKHTDVAIKQLLSDDISSDAKEEFEIESQVMARLRSPNIVQFYGYCLSPRHCIVMEYMPNGSLFSVLRNTKQPLDWTIRARIAINIASGLAFLHHEHILHRDIKSLNVLLDKSYGAKLTDFGLSRVKTETKSHSMATQTSKNSVGTIAWMAPELFKRKPVYTQKSDIYSLGITFWELAARQIPYSESPPEAIPTFVQQGEREDIPKDCPQKLASLITACWESSPEKRPDADTVVTYLKSEVNDFAQFLPLFASHSSSAYQSNLHSAQVPATAYQDNFHSGPIVSQVSDAAVATDAPTRSKRRGSNILNFADKKEGREKTQYVLEELRTFFAEERDIGEKTENYTVYNEYLKKVHNDARLVYKPMQNKHILYVDDAPLDNEAVARELSKMIKSLSLNTSETVLMPPPPPVLAPPPPPPLPVINVRELPEFNQFLTLLTEDEQDKAEDVLDFIVNSKGEAVAISVLKAAGAAIVTMNKNGETLVYIAAKKGHPKVINALKAAGANMDMPNKNKMTPVFVAAREGHSSAITALHAAGANVDTPIPHGSTPVNAAAGRGHAEAIITLHMVGANMNRPTKDGWTPIYHAAYRGHAAAVSALLEAGANAAVKINSGSRGTALEVAKMQGHSEVVRILKEHLKQYPNGVKSTGTIEEKNPSMLTQYQDGVQRTTEAGANQNNGGKRTCSIS